MGNRPTLADIAERAGVSIATVDRVLNARAPVRDATARRVFDAAHAIGYHASAVIGQRLKTGLPSVRLGFVLRKERQPFYQQFARAIEVAVGDASQVRAEAHIVFEETSDAGRTASCFERLAGKVDAISAIAVNHPKVANTVQQLRHDGIPCFALLSDFAQGERQCYLGLNNVKVGRMAAWMIAKTATPGPVAVFVGSHRWHGHELRETGFRSYFREYAPDFPILDTLINLETRRLTREATADLLHRHRNLAGFYVAGGGMEGALEAVREAVPPEKLAVVVNELTPESRSALQDRHATMVIATPLEQLCRDIVTMMIDAHQQEHHAIGSQRFLAPLTFMPESI